jgi:hypothetical protein
MILAGSSIAIGEKPWDPEECDRHHLLSGSVQILRFKAKLKDAFG